VSTASCNSGSNVFADRSDGSTPAFVSAFCTLVRDAANTFEARFTRRVLRNRVDRALQIVEHGKEIVDELCFLVCGALVGGTIQDAVAFRQSRVASAAATVQSALHFLHLPLSGLRARFQLFDVRRFEASESRLLVRLFCVSSGSR
jgi:hypothetical protein